MQNGKYERWWKVKDEKWKIKAESRSIKDERLKKILRWTYVVFFGSIML